MRRIVDIKMLEVTAVLIAFMLWVGYNAYSCSKLVVGAVVNLQTENNQLRQQLVRSTALNQRYERKQSLRGKSL